MGTAPDKLRHPRPKLSRKSLAFGTKSSTLGRKNRFTAVALAWRRMMNLLTTFRGSMMEGFSRRVGTWRRSILSPTVPGRPWLNVVLGGIRSLNLFPAEAKPTLTRTWAMKSPVKFKPRGSKVGLLSSSFRWGPWELPLGRLFSQGMGRVMWPCARL